jgi:UDP-N-acetylenolpyruvoylglucosamine reductase
MFLRLRRQVRKAGGYTRRRKLSDSVLERPMKAGANIADELAGRVSPATTIRRNELLAKHTTLRVGGPADVYVEPASEADLAGILTLCNERELPFFVMGRGSNLLVRDGGFRGVVICLVHASFSRVEVAGERLHCGAGAKLKNVAIEAKRNGLSGVEFLEGIPGSVGGALRMNAGAMGGATFDAVESVRVMEVIRLGGGGAAAVTHPPKSNCAIVELTPKEMSVEYRGCGALKANIALGVVFKCRPAPRGEIEQRMKAFNEKRWESQPTAPSAGCTFKNPATIPAGRLIDELGLKGTRVGGAVVSAEHGNFIVNDGHATARDVLELIAILQARAKEVRGIELQTEIEIIGEEI